MIGAPALCATAALRAGAGLVKIATWEHVLPFALAIEPGATGLMFQDDISANLRNLEQADPGNRAVLAVGPGIGQAPSAGRLVNALLAGPRTVVLDADGLNLLAASGQSPPTADPAAPPVVMTPHPGEFQRLALALGIEQDATHSKQRSPAAVALARAHRCIVVLKGPGTVVTDVQRLYVNTTGNPALSTAGTGDVLSGVIASLIAQSMSPFDAASLGVYLHGLAADLWANQYGPSGLTARDLAKRLPEAFQRHRANCGD